MAASLRQASLGETLDETLPAGRIAIRPPPEFGEAEIGKGAQQARRLAAGGLLIAGMPSRRDQRQHGARNVMLEMNGPPGPIDRGFLIAARELTDRDVLHDPNVGGKARIGLYRLYAQRDSGINIARENLGDA